ncbi:unnamed protein product [Lota lota]
MYQLPGVLLCASPSFSTSSSSFSFSSSSATFHMLWAESGDHGKAGVSHSVPSGRRGLRGAVSGEGGTLAL